MSRAAVLNETADRLDRLRPGRPVRVAIDGGTAAGKTTLADELAALIADRGRPVIRTSIDGFHRPRAERHARGRHSAEGYYHDARDLPAVIALLLAPLGPGGDRRYRTASFDLDADRPLRQAPQTAPQDSVLIVDGTFLQQPALRDHWDVTILVRTSPDTAEARGLLRDMEYLGGEEAARALYAQRYRPAGELYERLCQPELLSDAVIDNNDLVHPRLHLRAGGRLS